MSPVSTPRHKATAGAAPGCIAALGGNPFDQAWVVILGIGGAPRYCKNRYANSERVSPLGSGRLRFHGTVGSGDDVSIKSSYLNQFREINIAGTQESGAELGDLS